MTTAPAVRKDPRVATVRGMLQEMQEQIKTALPKMVDPERFIRVCMTTIRTSPGLLECTPESLLGAIMRAAQLNLEPDNVLGRAYLVPYGTECTFIIGYKGLIELARRSGQVKDIYANIIYENEPFDIEMGTDRRIKHTPLPPEQRGEKKIGAYSVCHLMNGAHSFHFMWISEIEEIRDKFSKSAKSSYSPWKTRPEAMMLKTVVRQHSKWLPLTVQAQEAAARDEAVEMGIAHDLHLGDDEMLDTASAKAGDKTADNTAALAQRIKDDDGKKITGERLSDAQDEDITALVTKHKISDDATCAPCPTPASPDAAFWACSPSHCSPSRVSSFASTFPPRRLIPGTLASSPTSRCLPAACWDW